jgi:hypothetical protein
VGDSLPDPKPSLNGAGNGPGKEVMEMAKATRKIGRNAGNGRFTTVKKAQQAPKTHVVETIKKPKK